MQVNDTRNTQPLLGWTLSINQLLEAQPGNTAILHSFSLQKVSLEVRKKKKRHLKTRKKPEQLDTVMGINEDSLPAREGVCQKTAFKPYSSCAVLLKAHYATVSL